MGLEQEEASHRTECIVTSNPTYLKMKFKKMYMYIKCREKELEGYLANWEEGSAMGGGRRAGKG